MIISVFFITIKVLIFTKIIKIFYFTIPLNPMNAIARIPTVIRATGTPLNALGTSFIERCSRIPAKMTIARP